MIEQEKMRKDYSDMRPILFTEPNKFARPAQLEIYEHAVVCHGYQEFVLTKHALHVLPHDLVLQRKQALLNPFFCPRYLGRRTVLDLGANAGFFCFWAIQSGAEEVTAVDMDINYVQIIERIRSKFSFDNLRVIHANIMDWNEPADVVLALALIHWIYSCTASFGNLDAVVEKLAKLTKYMLIVEWIDPEDPAIAFFHHIDWNKEVVSGPYTLDAFEEALKRHFEKYKVIGEVSPTRKLFAAFRTDHEIDLSGPLPFLMPKEAILSSRCLAKHEGIEYWSRVYDGGDVIYKQTTLDLAAREALFLRELKSDYFPRIKDVWLRDDYSVVVLEKIVGTPLPKAKEQIRASPEKLFIFFIHCLNLLAELRKAKILHRDIRPENILIRDDGRPVLIDFGWATSDTNPYFTPQGLGASERVPDGSFCDVYSMGKVFEYVNQHRYPAFDVVIELMSAPDASLRITDPETLKVLFESVYHTKDYDGRLG